MKAGSNGVRIAEDMISKGLITSDIDYAGSQFENLKKGDILLIHKGAFPLALVKIIKKITADNLSAESFGIDYKVDIVSKYDELSKNNQNKTGLWGTCPPTGTFFKINSGNETFNRLEIWFNMIESKNEINNLSSLLKYKKQIVLQGPPGTGKTKLAKELAKELLGLGDNELNEDDIITALKNVGKIRTVAGNVEYEIVKTDEANKYVILKKSTETESFSTFSKIIEFYSGCRWKTPVENNDDRRAAAIAGYIFENKTTWQADSLNEQVKIIQFHPSYSYEDFVRGITAKPNQLGGGVIYEVENKTLASFAEAALRNYNQSRLSPDRKLQSQSIFIQQLDLFIEQINDAIDKDGFYAIGPDTTAKIVGLTDTSFIYSFDKRPEIRYQLLFSDLIKIDNHPQKVKRTLDVRDIAVGYLTMIGKHPYYFKVYNLIKSIELDSPIALVVDNQKMGNLKNYVLIIDEINRANLSSVLGELIYALEYRGEEVESIYALGENNKLILPPNLYIIGTMNTADRSVGHIDYAIRRRFAFVDVLPSDLSDELGDKFHKQLFDLVSELFNTNLSSEFEKKDVQLGHSYFIDKSEDDGSMKMRLEFEIKPLLLEYIKDGILVGGGIKNIVENINI